VGTELRERFADPEIQAGRHVRYQIGTAGAKGPNSNDTNGGVNGTPEPYWPADMVVDPKTNLMYIADGYGNRRVLIVDAATGSTWDILALTDRIL